jgi:hypothetical protein
VGKGKEEAKGREKVQEDERSRGRRKNMVGGGGEEVKKGRMGK